MIGLEKNIIGILSEKQQVTTKELISFTDATIHNIRTTISHLRKKGHKIKFAFGFYHYGGKIVH